MVIHQRAGPMLRNDLADDDDRGVSDHIIDRTRNPQD
jgi:hypothetical protein